MGASDFLSGGGPRFGARVLADSTLVRRSNEPDAAGRRPPVLQRSRGPTQLSLFAHLEPRSNPIDAADVDVATGADPLAADLPDTTAGRAD